MGVVRSLCMVNGEKYLDRAILVSGRAMKPRDLHLLCHDQAPGEIAEKMKRISMLYLGTGFHCLRPRFFMVQMPKVNSNNIFVKYLL